MRLASAQPAEYPHSTMLGGEDLRSKVVHSNGGHKGIRAALALAILLITISLPAIAVVVNFPDPGLEAAIRDAIGKPTGDILDSDLVGLSLLNASERSISNLEGIQYCSDLRRLNMRNNQIADISALSSLTNLTDLWMSNNQIVDISPLSGLTSLTNLWLTVNQIVDISALSSLTNLTDLWMSNNQIFDIGALSGLTRLEYIHLSINQIIDVSSLSGLSDPKSITLNGNRIVDISPISGFPNLTTLELDDNQVVDISPLASLPRLTWLHLRGNQIIDFSSLSGLPKLTDLWLDNNQMSDISALSSGWPKLDNLMLNNNQIVNINPVSGLSGLVALGLEKNQIIDIGPLSGLTGLIWLFLGENQIADVSALPTFAKLQELDLHNNQIYDISPLVNNAGIGISDDVDLRNNQLLLMPGSPDMLGIEALQSRGVDVTYDPQNSPADTAAVFRIDDGFAFADQTFHATAFETGAADVAEWVWVSEPVEPGDVLELDPINPQSYRRSTKACSSLLAGVASSIPGVILGVSESDQPKALLALTGIVPVKVTNEGGPIQPGDLLVTSSTPGHAMRWAGPDPCPCSLVGKALEPMTEEFGVILVLLTAH